MAKKKPTVLYGLGKSRGPKQQVRATILSPRAQPAFECGSLLPLSLRRACSRKFHPETSFATSKLVHAKAAASCRTLKLRIELR